MGVDAAEVSTYKEYVAGLLAGVATVIIGHPFDTVKVSHFPIYVPLFNAVSAY